MQAVSSVNPVSKGANKHNPALGMLCGSLAGVLAGMAMDGYWWVARNVVGARPEQKPRPGGGQRKDEPATQVAADELAEQVTGHAVPDKYKPAAGVGMHYATAVVSGLPYGIIAARRPRTGVRAGLLYGVVVWLLADEVLVRVLRLGPDSAKVPASQHAQALGAHLVFGAALALATRFVLRLFG